MLEAKYRESFLAFHITIHPAGIPGEIRGKCSNARWAVKSALQWTKSENIPLDMATTTLTSMDSDTILHRRYFEVLGDKFLRAGDDQVYSTVWQGGLFYNFGLDRSLFFTRVTGLLRTIWMIGFNIPLQSHSMSVSSYSLKLCCDNNLFDPTYQMDDMHFFVKSLVTRRGKVWLKPIYLPVICGPTSGNSFSEELWEWARQARRWSIGAYEIFHYVINERRNLGYLSTLRLGATIVVLYGLFQTIMFASTLVASPIWHYTQWQAGADHFIWYAVSIIPWLFIAWCFLMDAIFVRNIETTDGKVGLARNLLHFLSTPLVLLGYNTVSFAALHILAWKGKSVCTHDISGKTGLPSSGKFRLDDDLN